MSFARPPAVVDWAAMTDSDDDAESNTNTPGTLSPIEPQTEVARRAGPGLAEDSHTTPDASPVRELDFSERDISPIDPSITSTPPVRVLRSQEMRVDSAVPYTFKSVWSVTAGKTATSFSQHTKDANSSQTTLDHIHNRACDQLATVLRAHAGSVDYNTLMKAIDWRAKYQPCFGSLFSFLKRNKSIFQYNHSVVKLVEEEGIVSELLKVQWRDLKPLTPSAAILSSLTTAAETKDVVAVAPQPKHDEGVRSYSSVVARQ